MENLHVKKRISQNVELLLLKTLVDISQVKTKLKCKAFVPFLPDVVVVTRLTYFPCIKRWTFNGKMGVTGSGAASV